jgi:hypothetical protein
MCEHGWFCLGSWFSAQSGFQADFECISCAVRVNVQYSGIGGFGRVIAGEVTDSDRRALVAFAVGIWAQLPSRDAVYVR